MYELRDYQQDAVRDTRLSFANGHKAPCLVLSTGAGKTVCAGKIVHDAYHKGNSIIFVVHRQELADRKSVV